MECKLIRCSLNRLNLLVSAVADITWAADLKIDCVIFVVDQPTLAKDNIA